MNIKGSSDECERATKIEQTRGARVSSVAISSLDEFSRFEGKNEIMEIM